MGWLAHHLFIRGRWFHFVLMKALGHAFACLAMQCRHAGCLANASHVFETFAFQGLRCLDS